MTNVSPKQATLRMVERLAEDVSFEDIQYKLYVLQNIEKGLRDVEQGNTVSHEEAGEELAEWLATESQGGQTNG